jgi:plastocyanin
MKDFVRHSAGAELPGWRRLVAVAAVVGALAFAGYGLSGGFTVSLGPTGPSPQTVTVNWGDTLSFVNTDTIAHGITASRAELNTPTISPGATFTTVLTGRTSTYAYRQTGGGRNKPGAVVSRVVGSVSLKASKRRVLYGQSITLRGTASFAPVTVQRRAEGEHGWRTLASVQPGANGAWTTTVKPTLAAKYRATVAGGQIVSNVDDVRVTPMLTITSPATRTKAGHAVTISSRLTPGAAASRVTLLACNRSRGAWNRVASRRPVASGAVRFTWTAEAGRNYLRATVIRANVMSGYLPPTSRTIQIVAVAPKVPTKKRHPRPRPSHSC